MTDRAKAVLSASAQVVAAIAKQSRPDRLQREIAESLVRHELERVEIESLRFWNRQEKTI